MIVENIRRIQQEIGQSVQLVIVSKFRTIEEIREAYETGHRQFAENRVQALLERADALPSDIEWHMIGHLQSNKVKHVVPFIKMIQSVDSVKLLKEIDMQAEKNNRVVDCLLQVHIAEEESKFGFSMNECHAILASGEPQQLGHVRIRGLMGMATNTNDMEKVKQEMKGLKTFFDSVRTEFNLSGFDILSMGMSSDYRVAVACGSNMVRVGSKVFEG